jgi:hypothetical protein
MSIRKQLLFTRSEAAGTKIRWKRNPNGCTKSNCKSRLACTSSEGLVRGELMLLVSDMAQSTASLSPAELYY